MVQASKRESLVDDAAEGEVLKKKRPSAVEIVPGSKVKVRQIISDAIKADPKKIMQFAEIIAPRLLIGDFGLHNGNFRVKHNGDLVCLDYGAAFSKLNAEFDPYSKGKGTIGTWKRYKNHFLEYDDRIIKGPEMAIMFIKIGRMGSTGINNMVKNALVMANENYDLNGLKKFSQRLGIKNKELKKYNTPVSMSNAVENFMRERLTARSYSMKNQGISLLLDNCYNTEKQTFNIVKFTSLIENHKMTESEVEDIFNFAYNDEFKNSHFILDKKSKDNLIVSMSKLHNEVREYTIDETNFINKVVYRFQENIPFDADDRTNLRAMRDNLMNLITRNPLLRFKLERNEKGQYINSQYRELRTAIEKFDQDVPTAPRFLRTTKGLKQQMSIKKAPLPLTRRNTSPNLFQ